MKPFAIQLLALDIDGVLTDGRVLFNAKGEEQKFVSFQDMDAVFEARRRGLEVALITGENTPWVDFIGRRLQILHVMKRAKNKLEAIRKLGNILRIPLSSICYVGDSDRDARALAAVGVGMAPANGTAKAKAAARLVLQAAGGAGAIQEVIRYLHPPRNSLWSQPARRRLKNLKKRQSLGS